MTKPTADNAVTHEDGEVSDEAFAELLDDEAVPAADPQPKPISVTDFFLLNFTRVHAMFKHGFGKTTVKPEYLFAVMAEAAKYANIYSQIEIQKIEQQQAQARAAAIAALPPKE